MKETPLLFSLDMVRAYLANKKCVTRRLCKPMNAWVKQDCRDARTIDGRHFHFLASASSPIEELRCPYGGRGDALWVRESWRVSKNHDSTKASHLPFISGLTIMYAAGGSRAKNDAAEYENDYQWPRRSELIAWAGKLRPSIFLPRVAARIVIPIISVRIERLQEITEADAVNEGVKHLGPGSPYWRNYVLSRPAHNEYNFTCLNARDSYRTLWDSLNEERGHGWDTNPWVWRIKFPRFEESSAQVAA